MFIVLTSTVLSMLSASSSLEGTATVPLTELTQLLQPKDAAARRPPVPAVVEALRLKARLGADNLHVDVHVELNVLTADTWTQLKLLELGPGAFVQSLPAVPDAAVSVIDQTLLFLSEKPGRYAFDATLVIHAEKSGSQRSAQIKLGPDAPRVAVALEADPAIFRVLSKTVEGEGREPRLLPGKNRDFVVSWTPVLEEKPRSTPVAQRPPIEPIISDAHAVFVSTLEGKGALRMRYVLKLDREQTLELNLPPGTRLDRVVLNQQPIAAPAQDSKLSLVVRPASVGDSVAVLELALFRELGVFHLSGRLNLELPAASWPVTRLEARTHLPAVFRYKREGGSMEPDEAPDASTNEPALPGTALHFKQHLLSGSAPTLELSYFVDLAGSYFR